MQSNAIESPHGGAIFRILKIGRESAIQSLTKNKVFRNFRLRYELVPGGFLRAEVAVELTVTGDLD